MKRNNAQQVSTAVNRRQVELTPVEQAFRGKKPSGKTALFLREYIRDFSARKAAKRCGFTVEWADAKGTKAVRAFADYVTWIQGIHATENAKQIALDSQSIFDEMTKIAMHNVHDYITSETTQVDGKDVVRFRWKTMGELTKDQAVAIKAVNIRKDGSFKYEFYDKTAELFKLGRHLGMFSEKIILEHRHKHLHLQVDFSKVPIDVLEKMEKDLEVFLPTRVKEAQ